MTQIYRRLLDTSELLIETDCLKSLSRDTARPQEASFRFWRLIMEYLGFGVLGNLDITCSGSSRRYECGVGSDSVVAGTLGKAIFPAALSITWCVEGDAICTNLLEGLASTLTAYIHKIRHTLWRQHSDYFVLLWKDMCLLTQCFFDLPRFAWSSEEHRECLH